MYPTFVISRSSLNIKSPESAILGHGHTMYGSVRLSRSDRCGPNCFLEHAVRGALSFDVLTDNTASRVRIRRVFLVSVVHHSVELCANEPF
jgi:hypothetical protein